MLFLATYGRKTIFVCFLIWAALGAAGAWVHPALVALPALGLAFTLYFFRDPQRRIPDGETNVVSPADGTVVEIGELPAGDGLKEPAIRIGIFLSVLDVHVNRAPCSGMVRSVEYRPGRFLNAMSPRSSGENESNSILLETLDHGWVRVRQIAGKIARRIVCSVKEGEQLNRGQRIGMIQFGSRTELILERQAVDEVIANVGDKVKGGRTILARFRSAAP